MRTSAAASCLRLTWQRRYDGVTFAPISVFRRCDENVNQEEEEWGRSFQSGVESTSSLCTEDDEEEEEEETR